MHSLPSDLLPTVLQSIANGVVVWDAEGRMIFANEMAARMNGYGSVEELMAVPREELVARFEILDSNGQPMKSPRTPGRDALQGGGPSEGVVHYREKGSSADRWSFASAVPINNDDGTLRAVVSSFRDITNEVLARRRAEESGLRQAFLAEASHELASSLDYETTLAAIARLAVPRIADWCTIDLIDEDGEVRRLATTHSDPTKVDLAAELQRKYPVHDYPPQALQTGQPVLYAVITEDMLREATPDEELREIVRQLGLTSAMALPLIARGRTIGALTFVAAESGRQYTEDDLSFAEDLAHRAALSVDNARLYRELDQRVMRRTRELEEQLGVTREQAQLLEAAPDGILVRDWHSTNVKYWSHGAEQMYGWTRAEALGQNVHELLRTQFPKRLEEITDDLLRVGHWEGELIHTRKDSSQVTVSSRWVLQRNEEGQPTSFLEVNTDIGPLKQAEEEHAARIAAETVAARTALLAESSHAFAEAGLEEQPTLDAIAQWVAEAIGDSCIIRLMSEDRSSLVPAAFGDTDPERRTLLGEMVRAFVHRAEQQPAAQVLRTGRPLRIPVTDPEQVRQTLPPEQWTFVERLGVHSLLYTPISVHGSVIGVMITARRGPGHPYTEEDEALLQSVGDRAALAIENARLYHEAIAALQVRDEFLAVAAHELKTPITGLRLAADLFLRSAQRGEPVPSGLERVAGNIREQAIKLTHLVEQLLDVSRIEAGRLALDRRQVNLSELVRNVVGTFNDRGDDTPIVLRVPPEVPAAADPLRVEQVIVNLLENARKYSSPTSAIEVEAWSEGDVARIAVRDYGPGVPDEHRERIFDRFYQVDPLIHAPGMGLGLYISRQVAQLHSGSLVGEYPPDGGSRFVLTLPTSFTPS